MSCTTSTTLLFMILLWLLIVSVLLCCRQDMLKKRLTRNFPHQYQKPRMVMYRADAGSQRMQIFERIRGPQPNGKSFSQKEQIRKHLPNSCMLYGKMQTLQQWAQTSACT